MFPDFKRPNGRIWGMLCIDLILKHENLQTGEIILR